MNDAMVARAPAVPTAALRGFLQHALRQRFGPRATIAGLQRRPSPRRSSLDLEEVDVSFADGTELPLIFKNANCRTRVQEGTWAKPDFVCNPLREIATYRHVLAQGCPGTATCYGAVTDHRTGRYWLFLERVPGLELYQVAFAGWQQAARWLAALHSRYAGSAGTLRPVQTRHLLRYDARYYRLWLRRARALLEQEQPAGATDALERLAWLAPRYRRAVERLVTLPATLIHGEFYASNVLIQVIPATTGMRVCVVDWEMAAVGPGLVDLAALTAGSWSEDERRDLALTYREALQPTGGWPPAPDAFLAALDCCRLHLAVQWLGWSADAAPAPHKHHDWLGEALRLAERLGL
jgi:hypothetical protein